MAACDTQIDNESITAVVSIDKRSPPSVGANIHFLWKVAYYSAWYSGTHQTMASIRSASHLFFIVLLDPFFLVHPGVSQRYFLKEKKRKIKLNIAQCYEKKKDRFTVIWRIAFSVNWKTRTTLNIWKALLEALSKISFAEHNIVILEYDVSASVGKKKTKESRDPPYFRVSWCVRVAGFFHNAPQRNFKEARHHFRSIG